MQQLYTLSTVFNTLIVLTGFNIHIYNLGKSLIAKEKAIQASEKEKKSEELHQKIKADPVFFISLVGVDKYKYVDKYIHIFDIYSKEYDFLGCDVEFKSAQDLLDFYRANHPIAWNQEIDIYWLAEYFVKQHPNGHFVFDECPFPRNHGEFRNNLYQ